MSGFFALDDARSMFDKAEREYKRLQAEQSIDNIFNFFVTAYHIGDYLRSDNKIAPDAIKALLVDPDMERCAHVCNKSKHAVLTRGDFNPKQGLRRPSPTAATENGTIGGSAINAHVVNGSPEISLYYPDTQERVFISPLADRVMQRLICFIEEHNI